MPQTTLGSLQRSPKPSSRDLKGRTFKEKGGKKSGKGEEDVKNREKRGRERKEEKKTKREREKKVGELHISG